MWFSVKLRLSNVSRYFSNSDSYDVVVCYYEKFSTQKNSLKIETKEHMLSIL